MKTNPTATKNYHRNREFIWSGTIHQTIYHTSFFTETLKDSIVNRFVILKKLFFLSAKLKHSQIMYFKMHIPTQRK